MPLGLLGAGEEEGAVHLVEGCAARVFHPNGTVLPPVDTTDGAPLYPFGVGYVDDRPDDRILGTVVLLLGNLGGVGLGGGGGGGVVVGIGLEGVIVCRCDRFPFGLLTSRLLYVHLTIPYRTLTFVSLLFSAPCCILPSNPMQPTDKTLLHRFESSITFKKSLSVFIASHLP